jgi:putative nucleotidyltransferase with HDIG domain
MSQANAPAAAGKTAAPNQTVVDAAIREISHIATLPEITVKIIELVEDPSSTAQDLHNVISNDPALCSRILKVVNSSFYGLPGQIGSINRAIVLLGLNAVKNIAISASLAKLFRGGELCPNFAARDLWQHSIITATAAKLVADELAMGIPDEAFLSGLIHDIGVMVEMQYNRDKLVATIGQLAVGADGAPTKEMLAIESEVFGANHQQFGAALCGKWKFPAVFAQVCGHHHKPSELPAGSRVLPAMVHVADRLAGGYPKGYRLDLVSLTPDPAAMDEIKLSAAKLPVLQEKLAKTLAETSALLA